MANDVCSITNRTSFLASPRRTRTPRIRALVKVARQRPKEGESIVRDVHIRPMVIFSLNARFISMGIHRVGCLETLDADDVCSYPACAMCGKKLTSQSTSKEEPLIQAQNFSAK